MTASTPRWAPLALVAVIIMAGCLEAEQGGQIEIPVQPVSVETSLKGNHTVEFRLENQGDQRTAVEPLFYSSEHWRGYAGGGLWNADAQRVAVPDYLVLVGEDGITVPWTRPLWNGTYPPGNFITCCDEVPYRLLGAGNETTVSINLSDFAVPRSQTYQVHYQVYGVKGTLGPVDLEAPGSGGANLRNETHSPHASALWAGLKRVQAAKGPGDPLLVLGIINLGPDGTRLRTDLRCTDSDDRSRQQTGESVVLLTDPGVGTPEDTRTKTCNRGKLDGFDEPLANSQELALTVPRDAWGENIDGEQSVHVGLQVLACTEAGRCEEASWLIRCTLNDGVGMENSVPDGGGDGQLEDPSGGAPADHYMMGVPLEPWACKVDWT